MHVVEGCRRWARASGAGGYPQVCILTIIVHLMVGVKHGYARHRAASRSSGAGATHRSGAKNRHGHGSAMPFVIGLWCVAPGRPEERAGVLTSSLGPGGASLRSVRRTLLEPFLILAAPAAPPLDEALDAAVDRLWALDLRQVAGVAYDLQPRARQLVAHPLERSNRHD